MSKIDVFRKIYELHVQADEYLEKIPSDARSFFFDNGYANPRGMITDVVMEAYFTEAEYLAVNWFLYEWTNDNNLTATFNDQEHSFKDINDYIGYLVEYEGWE